MKTGTRAVLGSARKDGASISKRWGVVLAGGDGVRLRRLTRFICGDDRPKQFCPLFGGATLLAHARQRAEHCIPQRQLLFSLTRGHEEFYLPDLADCPEQRIVQPRNRGTALGIVSSLLHIAHADPEATMAILPSDHYFSHEKRFADDLDSAFRFAEWQRDSLIVLGAQADSPETEYGWIEPSGGPPFQTDRLLRVRGFHEKPPLHTAQSLLERRAVWNTFVMVGTTQAFLSALLSTVPSLVREFRSQGPFLRSGEVRIPDSLYERVPHTDFSRQVLSAAIEQLLVFRLGPVGWSDLGDPGRALAALSSSGSEPVWAGEWRRHIQCSLRGVSAAVA